MWMHTGYRIADGAPIPPQPLTVVCCGHYRLRCAPRFHTARPQGRPDYQLLYVAAGRVRFLLEGRWVWVPAGQAVLYRPEEAQDYIYHLADHPEVYWIHFAGSQAAGLLERHGLTRAVTAVGQRPEYSRLFEEIIRDIQLDRPGGEDMTAALLVQLVVALSRGSRQPGSREGSPLVEQTVAYLQSAYAQPLSLTAYARSLHVELCWLTRLFRRQMGMSPRQYLLELRLSRACDLLRSTDCPVGEVARMVGYEDPLYFSRLFSRRMGVSPTRYRKEKVDTSTTTQYNKDR